MSPTKPERVRTALRPGGRGRQARVGAPPGSPPAARSAPPAPVRQSGSPLPPLHPAPESPAEAYTLSIRGATRRPTRRQLEALASLRRQFPLAGHAACILRPWQGADLALIRSASWHEAVPITNPHQPAR